MAVQVVNEVTTAAVSNNTTAAAPSTLSSPSLPPSLGEEQSSPSVVDEKNGDEVLPLLLQIILTDPDEHTTNTNNNSNDELRNLSLTKAVATLSTPQLLAQLELLDEFRRSPTNNLYQRVRALFFLYAVHRFHLPERRRLLEKRRRLGKTTNNDRSESGGGDNNKSENHGQEMHGEKNTNSNKNGRTKENQDATFICPKGYAALVDRRFDEAIDHFLKWVSSSSSTMTLSASADTEVDCSIDDGGEGRLLYPVPRTTCLISNLTFSRDGPLPVTTTTAVASATAEGSNDSKSNDASLSRGHSSSIASSSTMSSHVSEEATTTPPPPSTKKQHSKTPSSPQQQQILLLPSEATSSALAKSYRSLAFQTLADQVKRSVRSHDGNEWMFNVTNVGDMPLCWSEELLRGLVDENEEKLEKESDSSPMLVERTPVRMDLSHVSWTDFLIELICYHHILCGSR